LFLDVPLDDLVKNPGKYLPENDTVKTYVVCRLGNDSQTAAEALREFNPYNGANRMCIMDVIGGLRAWTREVDPGFPEY
jgi:adenylyltransferase and sulfurtransferase